MGTQDIAQALLIGPRLHLPDLPDQPGLYLLWDHEEQPRYVGLAAEPLRKRIDRRHVTGSEDTSHKFSWRYNIGRMFRDRANKQVDEDAQAAKDLRTAFIRKHCRASVVTLEHDKAALAALESQVISLLSPDATAWNAARTNDFDEPTALLDQLLEEQRPPPETLAALERQATLWRATRGADLP